MIWSADFIDGGAGKILVTTYVSKERPNHAVLVLPAFGEEMNKSRRLIRDTAVLLTSKGYGVVVPDLYATGDSQGDFADASWTVWTEDLLATIKWIRKLNINRFSVLAIRFGALFMQAILTNVAIERCVTWAPIKNGGDVIRQLIRTKSLNLRMSGQTAPSTAELRNQLFTANEPTEFAGYQLGSQLAKEISDAAFSLDCLSKCNASLIVEFGQSKGPQGVDPLSDKRCETKPSTKSVSGERFWLVLEPGQNPDLVRTTAQFFPAV